MIHPDLAQLREYAETANRVKHERCELEPADLLALLDHIDTLGHEMLKWSQTASELGRERDAWKEYCDPLITRLIPDLRSTLAAVERERDALRLDLKSAVQRMTQDQARITRLKTVLREYIAADERTLGFAQVMLGVNPDGSGPGESRTGAVANVSDRLANARKALDAARAPEGGGHPHCLGDCPHEAP